MLRPRRRIQLATLRAPSRTVSALLPPLAASGRPGVPGVQVEPHRVAPYGPREVAAVDGVRRQIVREGGEIVDSGRPVGVADFDLARQETSWSATFALIRSGISSLPSGSRGSADARLGGWETLDAGLSKPALSSPEGARGSSSWPGSPRSRILTSYGGTRLSSLGHAPSRRGTMRAGPRGRPRGCPALSRAAASSSMPRTARYAARTSRVTSR